LGDFNPVRAFKASSVLTGRDLYREANRTSISEQATKDRESSGDPQSKQIGYFQRAEKSAWEGLSDEEKAHWDNEASEGVSTPEESYTSPHIIR